MTRTCFNFTAVGLTHKSNFDCLAQTHTHTHAHTLFLWDTIDIEEKQSRAYRTIKVLHFLPLGLC